MPLEHSILLLDFLGQNFLVRTYSVVPLLIQPLVVVSASIFPILCLPLPAAGSVVLLPNLVEAYHLHHLDHHRNPGLAAGILFLRHEQLNSTLVMKNVSNDTYLVNCNELLAHIGHSCVGRSMVTKHVPVGAYINKRLQHRGLPRSASVVWPCMHSPRLPPHPSSLE